MSFGVLSRPIGLTFRTTCPSICLVKHKPSREVLRLLSRWSSPHYNIPSMRRLTVLFFSPTRAGSLLLISVIFELFWDGELSSSSSFWTLSVLEFIMLRNCARSGFIPSGISFDCSGLFISVPMIMLFGRSGSDLAKILTSIQESLLYFSPDTPFATLTLGRASYFGSMYTMTYLPVVMFILDYVIAGTIIRSHNLIRHSCHSEFSLVLYLFSYSSSLFSFNYDAFIQCWIPNCLPLNRTSCPVL